jgi:hypothetical protein
MNSSRSESTKIESLFKALMHKCIKNATRNQKRIWHSAPKEGYKPKNDKNPRNKCWQSQGKCQTPLSARVKIQGGTLLDIHPATSPRKDPSRNITWDP